MARYRQVGGRNDPPATLLNSRKTSDINDAVYEEEREEDRLKWRVAAWLLVIWVIGIAAYGAGVDWPMSLPEPTTGGTFLMMLVGGLLLSWLMYLKGKEVSRYWIHRRIGDQLKALEYEAQEKRKAKDEKE